MPALTTDPQVQAAWVAILGTLLGALVGGGTQAWLGRRALDSARKDAADQRDEMRTVLDLQLREERFRLLWGERRSLFTRVLDACDEWHHANIDLAGLNLAAAQPEQLVMEQSTMAEARRIAPEAAREVESMHTFGRLVFEVDLLSDAEVRGAIRFVQEVLRNEARSAVDGNGTRAEDVGDARSLLVLAMRRELIHGTVIDNVNRAHERDDSRGTPNTPTSAAETDTHHSA